jgi:insulysin
MHNPEQILKNDLSFEDFRNMDKNNLTSGKFEWFISGNITPEQAIELTKKPEQVFKNSAEGKFELLTHGEDMVHIKPVKIEKNTVLNYVIHAQDKDNQNSCVLSYFQNDEETMRTKLLSEVVFQYLSEPTFDQLRTKEQLGYIASSFNIPLRMINGGGFIVQSAVGSPEFLIQRINAHLDNHKEEVLKVTDEYFNKMVDSIRNKKMQKDLNLRSETARLASEIVTHQYEFDRKNKEIEMLENLTKEEFTQYFHQLFYDEPKRLNIHLLAAQHLGKFLVFNSCL